VESPAAAMVHAAAGGSKAGTAEGAGTSEAQSHFRFTRANISAVGFPKNLGLKGFKQDNRYSIDDNSYYLGMK